MPIADVTFNKKEKLVNKIMINIYQTPTRQIIDHGRAESRYWRLIYQVRPDESCTASDLNSFTLLIQK